MIKEQAENPIKSRLNIMKVFKVRMKSGRDCGCKGVELQVPSNSISSPSCAEVTEALKKMGFKPMGTGALTDFEVVK